MVIVLLAWKMVALSFLNPFLPSMSDDNEPMVVGPNGIAVVASLWSGIPFQQVTIAERMLLVGLHEQFRKRVVGPDTAIASTFCAVKRSRFSLKDPNRPIAAAVTAEAAPDRKHNGPALL